MKLIVNQGLDEKNWDNFLTEHPNSNILQSWAWGEFQKTLGNTIWRFSVIDDKQIIAQLLAVKLSIGFGKYIIYAPRDILINKLTLAHHQHQAIKLIIKKIKELAPKHNLILFRTEPPILRSDHTSLSIYKNLGFKLSSKTLQPSDNLLIDISKSDIDILSNMKPKTRYNIKLAAKNQVSIKISKRLEDLKIFNQLNQETTRRGQFKSHSRQYYATQLDILGQANAMELIIAYWQDIPLSALLVTFFGKTATYLHGTSSWLHKEKMASHAAQWSAITRAKEKNCTIYDLSGINYDNRHPGWEGITRFKTGFGGKVVEYIGALELPLNNTWFKLYKFINLFKK